MTLEQSLSESTPRKEPKRDEPEIADAQSQGSSFDEEDFEVDLSLTAEEIEAQLALEAHKAAVAAIIEKSRAEARRSVVLNPKEVEQKEAATKIQSSQVMRCKCSCCCLRYCCCCC